VFKLFDTNVRQNVKKTTKTGPKMVGLSEINWRRSGLLNSQTEFTTADVCAFTRELDNFIPDNLNCTGLIVLICFRKMAESNK
jgi:hypothetical protein